MDLRAHARQVKHLLEALDIGAVAAAAEALARAILNGRTIFCAGNGGSAAIASHFATDLSWARRSGPDRPRAVSLVANAPLLTAVANDAGYDAVFVEQLRTQFRPQDVLVVISSSGNSANVVRATEFVNAAGGTTIGMVGFDGGRLKDLCVLCVHVPTADGAYEVVEDLHHIICHMLAIALKTRLGTQSASAPARGPS